MAIGDSIAAGLSGVIAAQRQFHNSANNIANQRSPAGPNPPVGAPVPVRREESGQGNPVFRPTDIVTQTAPGGGVTVASSLRNPSSVQLFAPGEPDAGADGTVFRGNVDPASERVVQSLAQRRLEANVAVIRTGDELVKSMIDIKT